MKELQMDAVDNKFIIMARIAVALRKKGFVASVTIHDTFCSMVVHTLDTYDVVEYLYGDECTEQELLNWLTAIEK